jgi:hypothetical protein
VRLPACGTVRDGRARRPEHTVPFNSLKHRVLNEHQTLGEAIRASKPDADGESETNRARTRRERISPPFPASGIAEASIRRRAAPLLPPLRPQDLRPMSSRLGCSNANALDDLLPTVGEQRALTVEGPPDRFCGVGKITNLQMLSCSSDNRSEDAKCSGGRTLILEAGVWTVTPSPQCRAPTQSDSMPRNNT